MAQGLYDCQQLTVGDAIVPLGFWEATAKISRFPILTFLSQHNAQSLASLANWRHDGLHIGEEMLCCFGASEELHSDQGQNFEAEAFHAVCKRLDVKRTRIAPLHPQSDGLVERFPCTLAIQLATLTS